MIIDFRLRPPFGEFKKSYIMSDIDFMTQWGSRFNMPVAESVKQQSIELCIKEMDEAKIDIGVIPGRKCFGLTNDDLIKLMELYPKRFICFAGVDPHDPTEDSINEIHKYVQNGPCSGVVIEPGLSENEAPGKPPMTPDDPRVHPIYEECQKHNIPLMISFGGLTNAALRYMSPFDIDNVAEKYPNLTIILAHGGFPWANEMCWIALRRPNVYISPDIYAMGGPGSDSYIAGASQLVPEKILFGSAYPMVPMKNAVIRFLNAGIKEEHLPKIMYQNAARILGLDVDN